MQEGSGEEIPLCQNSKREIFMVSVKERLQREQEKNIRTGKGAEGRKKGSFVRVTYCEGKNDSREGFPC